MKIDEATLKLDLESLDAEAVATVHELRAILAVLASIGHRDAIAVAYRQALSLADLAPQTRQRLESRLEWLHTAWQS